MALRHRRLAALGARCRPTLGGPARRAGHAHPARSAAAARRAGAGERSPEELVAGVGRGIAFTLPFNVTGQPAVSLPLYRTADGLPIGVQLVAAYGREDLLIKVASQLEQAAPWADLRPPVSADRG
ncbi:amidase family protein [Streptomyces sp. M19]